MARSRRIGPDSKAGSAEEKNSSLADEIASSGRKRTQEAIGGIAAPRKRACWVYEGVVVEKDGMMDLSALEFDEDEEVDSKLVPGVEGEVWNLGGCFKDHADHGIGLR